MSLKLFPSHHMIQNLFTLYNFIQVAFYFEKYLLVVQIHYSVVILQCNVISLGRGQIKSKIQSLSSHELTDEGYEIV